MTDTETERTTSTTRWTSLFLALTTLLAGPALGATALEGQQPLPGRLTFVPEVGVGFHSAYYDDRLITSFADDEVQVDRLRIDPGTSFRLGGRVEYGIRPGIRLHGGLAASWPDAESQVNQTATQDLESSVVEILGGAQLMLQELVADSSLPIYLAGDVGVIRHGIDDLEWKGAFIDASTLSLAYGGRIGFEYELAPGVTARGELKETLVSGSFGDLEGEISEVESRAAGEDADTDFEGNTFSLFSVNAGLAVNL